MLNNYLLKLKSLNRYEIILLAFPLCQILGPFYLNFILVLGSLFFLYFLIRNSSYKVFRGWNWIYLYLFFVFYNFIRGMFASDYINAMHNSLSQIRFILFSLFIFFCISNLKNLKLIINVWLILVFLVALDVIFQSLFLKDIFGFPIAAGMRASGPFGKELIAGAFMSYTLVPLIFYFFQKNLKLGLFYKIFYIIFYIFFFLAIALTGERLSFLIFFISSMIFLFFYTGIKKFIITSFLLFSFIVMLYFTSIAFQKRTNDLINISNNFYKSSYGRLWESGLMLFEKNKLLGVGLKNYRVDCDKQTDPRPESVPQFCSTHPHNFFIELLRETGLVGFFIFFTFFGSLIFFMHKRLGDFRKKNYFKEYYPLLFGNILILIVYVWPLKTSGSFFTTWNGSFFWLNLGLFLLITKKKYK